MSDKTEVTTDRYKYWTEEFASARKNSRKWRDKGKKIVKKFLDDRGENDESEESKVNLFFANVNTLQAMLYGNVPKVEVDRKFSDANDDVARVASVIGSRILQQDIEYSGEDFSTALRCVLEDRLLPGMGTARVKYEFKEKQVQVPAQIDPATGLELAPAYTETKIVDEKVPIIYVYWDDYLYGKARTHADVPWKAYRAYMDREELIERFGEELGNKIPLNSSGTEDKRQENGDVPPTEQADVWEIWDKKTRKVEWMVEGFDQILDVQEDPLELDGFFPEPMPFTANTTTTNYVPRADYILSQDLYTEIDRLQTRITLLTDACRAVGVYDKSNAEVKRIFEEGMENDLIPCDNWALLGEKGGLKGVIDWVPIEAIVNTINTLTQMLAAKVQQLYEVTGMSDILRGSSQKYEAAATSKAKVQFASIRVQRLQEEFARFASDIQCLKMEIIQKHFQPESILLQSNIQMTPDAQFAQQAIELLKNRDLCKWRIRIRPETLALADYAQLKEDRTAYINGVSLFMQSAAPLAEMDKSVVPTLLELMKWGLAGFKGANEIEGVMDRAIKQFTDKAKQPPPPPPPDPAVEKAKIEAQISQQEHQQKMQQEQGRMANEQAEFQQKMQLEREKFQAEVARDERRFMLEMDQLREKHRMQMIELNAELAAKREIAQIQMTEKAHAAKVQMESADHAARANKSGDSD